MSDQPSGKDICVQLAETAAGRPESDRAPARFSLATRATLVVGGVGLGVALLLALVGIGPYTFLAGLAAAVMGVVTLAALFKLVTEALYTAPGDRPTPEKALKAYLGSIKQQRWGAAAACLSWVAARGDEVLRPAMPDVDLAETRLVISGARDLAAYWGDFVGAMKTRGSRSLGYKVVATETLSATVACVTVDLCVTLDLKTAALGGEALRRRGPLDISSRVSCSGRWPVYRRGDLWYLLAAGIPADSRVAKS